MTLVRLARPGHLTLAEPGQRPRCDQGWNRFRADARRDDNVKHTWELRHRVRRYVTGHRDCTLRGLYRDLECDDIPVYIRLHLLVHDFQLSGPDPYACGKTHRVLHLPGPPSE